jgi:acetoin utilization protein AcuC
LTWTGPLRKHHPEAHWITTLRDAPREGPISDAVRTGVQILAMRRPRWA